MSYLVHVPSPTWDAMREASQQTLIVYTYVREDRLDLFGFRTAEDRTLFTDLLNLSGIGPKTAMEVCALPRSLLLTAIQSDDAAMLQEIKGVGRKTAEKLLVDLRQLLEKGPTWATTTDAMPTNRVARYDDDAIAALGSLGYDRQTILAALEGLPPTLTKTEDRVAAALRAL